MLIVNGGVDNLFQYEIVTLDWVNFSLLVEQLSTFAFKKVCHTLIIRSSWDLVRFNQITDLHLEEKVFNSDIFLVSLVQLKSLYIGIRSLTFTVIFEAVNDLTCRTGTE